MDVVMQHAHAEANGAPANCATHAAVSDDAESGASEIRPHEQIEVRVLPEALAYEPVRLDYLSRRSQDQCPGHVRRRLLEHARRVRRHDTFGCEGFQVEVLE